MEKNEHTQQPIHVLDPVTINKIAAGEVVERPASIVKELVENAIDAGATRVTIEIRDGGIRLIRVTDNGKGIPAAEIPLAFTRHATSKISEAADLDALRSLGFRGEALSSITAVSRVEMITKTADSLTAVRYLTEGGREKEVEEIGAPDGTTVIVRDLFYNTPARAKFLKSPMTEGAHVGSLVEELVLSNPSVAFQFLVNGQPRLSSTGSGDLKDALYHVYGRTVTAELLPAESRRDGLHIHGYVAKPAVSRGNRNFENYYVNGRYVKSAVIQRGIEEGYGTMLMQHQYPFTCLFLNLDGHAVDVNVHPGKMEVRFSDEKTVYEAVRDCVHEALAGKEMIIRAHLTAPEKESPVIEHLGKEEKRPAEPFETASLSVQSADVPHPYRYPEENDTTARPKAVREEPESFAESIPVSELPEAQSSSAEPRYEQETLADLPDAAEGFLTTEARAERRIVGQVFSTYWIVQYQDAMFILDQHAAHEKVLFERLMRQYSEDGSVSSQMVSPPMIVTLDHDEEARYLTCREAFAALGFEIEPFGGREYAISAVPYQLGGITSGDLFREILDHVEVSDRVQDLKFYIHRVATEACKAAVKGGGNLSLREAEALFDELMTLEDPYHCPHGRPTIITLTKKELEKKFKRIV